MTNSSQLLLAMGIGEEAEVANPHESVGQHMHHEATDELRGSQRERAWSMGMPIVFVTECDLAVVDGLQSPVGDRNSMRVASQILRTYPKTQLAIPSTRESLAVSQAATRFWDRFLSACSGPFQGGLA